MASHGVAQETYIALLGGPLTFLDPASQIKMQELRRLRNRKAGTALVAVLHNMNQVCRYADQVITKREGRVSANLTSRRR